MYRGLSTVDKTGMDSVSLDAFNARKRGAPRGHPQQHQHSHKEPLISRQTPPNAMHNADYDLSLHPKEWLEDITKRLRGGSGKKSSKGSSFDFYGLGGTFSIDNLRRFSFILHLVSWILITVSWSKVGNSDFHPRLSSNAYTMVDTFSAASALANRGLLTPMYMSNIYMGNTTGSVVNPNPGFPALTTSTMLHYAQPVMIRTDTASETYALSPSKSCTNNMLTNNNTAIWGACRASGVPMSLVDLTFLDNTLSIFGSNNIIALMYQTFFITMMLSMATLPPMEWNFYFPWPMISIILLFGNFLFTICAPFTLAGAHFPINNAAITAAMHLVAMVVIMMASRAKDRESVKREQVDRRGGNKVYPAPPPTEPENGPAGIPAAEEDEASQFKLHFLGRHLVSSDGGRTAPTYSNLWGRVHGYGSVADGDVSEVIRIVPMDGDSSATMEGNDMMHIGEMTHYGDLNDWMAGVSADGVFAMIPNAYFDYKWTEKKQNKLMMANFRYFEYSMTAGLFLVASMLTVDRTVDVYVLHMAYTGMLFCNLVAIPITKALVFWYKYKAEDISGRLGSTSIERDYGTWIFIAIGMVLFASLMFFMAAMVVIFLATSKVMLQSPAMVMGFYWITMSIYILFAVAGIITILMAVSYLSTQNLSGCFATLSAQVTTYEILNLGKAVLGIYFMAGMLTSTGLSV